MNCSLKFVFCCFLFAFCKAATPYERVRGTPYNVSYDERAFLINGERELFHVGAVHYARATPEMWPSIMQKSVNANINCIDTYVFWNYHEFEKGVYDFETENRNLVKFIEVAAEHGLFVTLRIGPYVCAEWTLGGMPSWLLQEDDMVFRTYNEGWLFYMETFVREVVSRVQHLLPSQGGPIMLMQIENEYGSFEATYGKDGTKYVNWCSEIAYEIEDELPWIMCEQPNAPIAVVETKNGFYSDSWLAGHFASGRNQPGAWTENWPGWFQLWGEPVPTRPTEDVAFGVARWFQRGGTYQSYYMWFGGTTFGRWVGGPFIITSYDYDVALNEYGFEAQPKYGHLADLHRVLDQYKDALLSDEVPEAIVLGTQQEGHIWGEIGTPGSVVFLANSDTSDAEIEFNNCDWLLPAWSVLIVDGEDGATPKDIVFDTSLLGHPTIKPEPTILQQFRKIRTTEEPIGGYTDAIVHSTPLSQLPITLDKTDYLWYSTEIVATSTKGVLEINDAQNYVYAFVDDVLVGEGRGPDLEFEFKVDVGDHILNILTMSMGLWNYGAFLETVLTDRGINGEVVWQGTSITEGTWTHRPGLKGEQLNFPTETDTVEWSTNWEPQIGAPMKWFEIHMKMPVPNPDVGYSLFITSMGKGAVWVNGYMLGRFWDIIGTGNCDDPCDYRGNYGPDKCRTECGEPSQSHYHLPRDWMKSAGGVNRIVIFTENGGDPSEVKLATRTEE